MPETTDNAFAFLHDTLGPPQPQAHPVVPVDTPTPPGTQDEIPDDGDVDFVDLDAASQGSSSKILASATRSLTSGSAPARLSSAKRPKPAASPGQKQRTRRRLHPDDDPAPPTDVAAMMAILTAKMDNLQTSQTTAGQKLAKELLDQQTTQINAIKSHVTTECAALHTVTQQLADDVQAHSDRLDQQDERQKDLESKLADLTSRFAVIESGQLLSTPNPTTPFPSTSPTLIPAFPENVSVELANRIAKARKYQETNANSFVIFQARTYLNNSTPETFAQGVATLFGGREAVVDKVTWLGAEQVHLKVTLSTPIAEHLGSEFFRLRYSMDVPYSLAPCRSKLMRDGLSRMRLSLTTLRSLRPEILPTRVTPTSVSFLARDYFDAFDFLYPAIRLGDGRIIPVSYIVNTPHIASIDLPVDPSPLLPGPHDRG
jgi:hypothetical protein